jgi:hypothetical protein
MTASDNEGNHLVPVTCGPYHPSVKTPHGPAAHHYQLTFGSRPIMSTRILLGRVAQLAGPSGMTPIMRA